MRKFVVTPWEVSGEVDYDRLVKEFGTERIDDRILRMIQRHTKDVHPMLRRELFFCHRDLPWLLLEYEKGNRFYLYTGRGPSGYTHLGHLVPWIFTRWLQQRFKVKLYFQLTDDEKYLFKHELSLKEANRFAYENALDFIALGFKPKNTTIFVDTDWADVLYKEALHVAKRVTFSTAKAVFGFTNRANIGQIFFTAMQAVPAFLESVRQGRNVPCLIPYAIDQDAHFRIARDVLPRLGYYKPAAIISRFLPGLGKGGKMSASQPETCIFTTDSEEQIRKKIANAFTGGRESIKEQRAKGGDPYICPIYQYFHMLFEPDDERLKEHAQRCLSGQLLCGEHKEQLARRICAFIKKHQKRREKARDILSRFLPKA